MPERISPTSVLAHVEVGVVVLDRTATVLFANPRALVLLGSTEREMMGSSSFDPRWQAVTPDGVSVPAEQHPVVQAIRTSQPVRDTVLGFRKGSGERVWLQITAIPTVDATGTVNAVYATFTDVSRGQAHQNRLTSTYEATVRSMAEGVTIQGHDGKMLSANPAAERILGLSLAQLQTARRCRPRKSRRHTRAAPASRAATRAYWCIGQTASACGCRWRPIC
jgi:PAS domain S-box-containing protein